MSRVLILGFYHRGNLGDDAYVPALERVLGAERITFACVDDIDRVPDDVDVIVCGGGEVINLYFMSKLRRLLKGFTGRVVAVSVGVAYESERAYFKMFDHAFVRSRRDFDVAVSVLGERNVTLAPDVAFYLSCPRPRRTDAKNAVAVCLAQPYFHDNGPAAEVMEAALVEGLTRYGAAHPASVFHFVPFNRSSSPAENDRVVHRRVLERLASILGPGRVLDRSDLVGDDVDRAPERVLEFFSRNVKLVVGMRFHSIVFALRAGVPFVAVALPDQKIDKLLTDRGLRQRLLPLDADARYKPKGMSADDLSALLLQQRPDADDAGDAIADESVAAAIRDVVLRGKRPRALRVDYERRDAFDDLAERIAAVFVSVLGPERVPVDVQTPRDLLFRTGPLVRRDDEEMGMRLARFACYVLTNNTDHACVWGLRSRLSHPRLKLWDTLAVVWNVHNATVRNAQTSGEYYVDLDPPGPRKVWWTLDRTTFAQEYSALHRAGWAYAISGLMHHDANMMGRDASDAVLIDTYLDRTFHWSREVFERLDIIPYRRPWYGFVHHTFDTTFSDYNCVQLLKCPSFLASLPACKGIVTLSRHLADRMRRGLAAVTDAPPPVYAIDHPTEPLDESQCFSMTKLYANPRRRVVQIGAWLRDSYAIYALPLPASGGPLGLRKACLRWKNMSQSFAPVGFADRLEAWLDVEAQTYACYLSDDAADSSPRCCRNHGGDAMCRNHDGIMCRNDDVHSSDSSEAHSRNHVVNKHVEGMRLMLAEQEASVEILEGLPNDDYDRLLQENVVFLRLVEPSAVNTVIECLVRNTPIVVNRTPAVEEMLGESYPGFYDDLFEAACILADPDRIERCHRHIAALDKDRYRLERFVARMQDIVASDSDGRPIETSTTPATAPVPATVTVIEPEQPLIEPTQTLPAPIVVSFNRPLYRVQRYIPQIFRR